MSTISGTSRPSPAASSQALVRVPMRRAPSAEHKRSPSASRAPSPERRRQARPAEGFSSMIFANSALTGSIPCTAGEHSLKDSGLEQRSWLFKDLSLNIPADTRLQVHSHAIDREAVTAIVPRPSATAWLTGFFSFWTLTAWMWLVGTFGGAQKRAEWPRLKPIEEDPKAPRDGVLRVHGLEAAITQATDGDKRLPLTVTRQGIPPWVACAEITGASVDEHGRVTPQGQLRILRLFGVSLERFRRAMPVVNTEVEKLRQGELLAAPIKRQESTQSPVPLLARLIGKANFTIVRQPDAPPLHYDASALEEVTSWAGDLIFDLTPLWGEIKAEVQLNADATLDVEATEHASNNVHLRSRLLGEHVLRVETDSTLTMPRNGAELLRGHTMFIVDRSTTGDPMADVWEPLVEGSIGVMRRPAKLRATAHLRLNEDVVPGLKGSPHAHLNARWQAKGNSRSWSFEHGTAHLPALKKVKDLNMSCVFDDTIDVKVGQKGHGRIHATSTSRVVDVVDDG